MNTFESRSFSSGGLTQTVRTTTTTRQEFRTYHATNGEVIQDGNAPIMNGDHQEVVQNYTYSSRNGYGDNRGYSSTSPDYVPGDEFRTGPKGPGSLTYRDNAPGVGRLSPDSMEPRGSSSSQGSTSERITQKTTSYVESMPPGDRLQTSSRSSSQSSLTRAETGGRGGPDGSQTLPRSFGQTEPSNVPRDGSSTMPRSQGKAKGNITYNLSMKVGDVRGSGADGNVYIQLFGSGGKTAKIQLRQAGDSRNKFEKGKTYKFTVDTVDIGLLERIKLSHDHRGYGSGFFVDEVEVEIPSRNDRVTFPCHCWLAQDIDDGRTERDMVPSQPSKPAPTTNYTMSVRVGEVKNSQTNLYVQLFGEKGETSKIMLRPAGPSMSRFEPGRTYKFTVETVDIGKTERLRMGQDSKSGSQGLYVESIEVDPEGGEKVVFPCQCWSEDDDVKAPRDILAQTDLSSEPRSNVDYHLTIRTGDRPGAGTDAPVFIQIVGDDGETERIELSPGGTGDRRFDRGRTDKFVIGTLDVGKPHTIRIGQLGHGPESSWYLNEVIVDIPTRNEHYLYPCDSWLAEDEGDGGTETELFAEVYKVPLGAGAPPESQPPISKKPPAFVEEKIQNTNTETVEAAPPMFDERRSPPRTRSPENVRPPYEEEIQRTSPKPTSIPPDELDNKANVAYELCLKIGDVQGSGTEGTVFIELIGDKGKTERIRLREANDERIRFDKGKSYKFTIETLDVGKVDKVRIGHDSHGPGQGWYLEELSVSVPSRDELQVFPCHCWFAEDQGDGKLERELSSTRATYHLALATGDVANGGTEAIPYIQIFGERGDTGIIELRKEGSSGFVRGKTDFFNVDAVDVGEIEKIRVGHDGQGYDGGWFLEEVVLDCPQHGEHFIFPCHCWLSDVETDRQTEREFLPEPVSPYKIVIRTGARPGAGTDANIYMQIFGDQGDTGIIDLKQVMLSTSGQFRSGKECELELVTVDVGMLEKVRIGHDNSGRDPAWYLDEVMIILRDQCWVLPCHDWLDENRGDTERILFPETKTFAQEPDLEDLIAYLGSDDVVLIVNSEAYLQHLFYRDDGTKNKFRALNGIPALVRLLDSRNEDVHRGAAGTLRNLSFSKANDENKIAIARCDGVLALMRLLQRTDRIELKELLLSIIWNMSSCERLKRRILEECLLFIVTTFVIPDSGWDKRDIEPVRWTMCFRNGTGILRNLSSAGLEARKKMRDVIGLIDSLLYVIRLSLGKPGADVKAVENCVCILRNLSYRLEEEVDRQKYLDTDLDPDRPERTIYGGPDKTTAGFFSKKSKKKGAMDRMPVDRAGHNAKEGVALLWQPETISPILTLLAESSNAETLEAATGMIHNLTACLWRWSALLRSTLRREKGLPILVELLRVDDDSVIRADATALRNLAIDTRNKVVIGKYAMKDLVHRLPPGEGSQGLTEPTYGAIICTIHQLVDQSSQNAKAVRDVGGVVKLVRMAKGNYTPKVVKTANQVLISMWNFKETRTVIDKAGWQYTKKLGEEYGQFSQPKAYDDVSLPRSAQKSYSNQPRYPQTTSVTAGGNDTDRSIEMQGYGVPYAGGDSSRASPGPSQAQEPPTSSTTTAAGPPEYAKVNKNRKKVSEGEDEADSWV